MRDIKWIVVHTAAAATPQGMPVFQSAEDVDAYHRKHNGWRKIGYHSFIEKDGRDRRDICRRDEEVGAHAGGFNEHSLGVCVSGHGDFADLRPEQGRALIARCVEWCRLYGLPASAVIGHRETQNHGGPPVFKTCPGMKVSMTQIREDVARALVK